MSVSSCVVAVARIGNENARRAVGTLNRPEAILMRPDQVMQGCVARSGTMLR